MGKWKGDYPQKKFYNWKRNIGNLFNFKIVNTFLNLTSLASNLLGDNFFAFSDAHHSSEPSSTVFERAKLPWVWDLVSAEMSSYYKSDNYR